MPQLKDTEPRYVSDEEAAEHGFFPDKTPPEDIEVYGPTPTIITGKPFERIPGKIRIGTTETVELPPETRFTAKVIEQGLDGEFRERPATSSEIGGGLLITPPEKIELEVKKGKKRTHKRSSRKLFF